MSSRVEKCKEQMLIKQQKKIVKLEALGERSFIIKGISKSSRKDSCT